MVTSKVIHFGLHGKSVQMYLPDDNDHITKQIKQAGVFYELKMLEDIRGRITPDSVIIDIGANIGNHTVYFGLFCNRARVFSFEPNPDAVAILNTNVEINNLSNSVTVFPMALGSEFGRGEIILPCEGNQGMAKVEKSAIGNIQIKTLDSLLLDRLDRCDVIKIDVEGMELEVLKGSEEILRRFKPMLYIECATEAEHSAVSEYLARFGYQSKQVFNATPTYRFEARDYLDKTKETNNTGRNGLRIAFFAGDEDNFHFAQDIIKHLERQGYQIRIFKSKGMGPAELHDAMKWSDVSWFEWGVGPIVTASRLPKVCKIICRIHKYEVYTDAPKAINWANIDDVIFVSPVFLDVFKELHHIELEEISRVHIIPNGLDLTKFQFRHKERGFNIAYISRFHSAKNPALLLQIMAELVKRDARYHCHVIGRIQDVTEWQYFKQMVDQLGLKDHVHYHGVVENVNEWLDDKHFIISTSIIESQGVGIMEGMAKGLKPVIHNYFGNPAYLFGEKFVFNTVSEAVDMILSDEYTPSEYRRVIEDKYDNKVLLKKIEAIVDGRDCTGTVGKEVKKGPFISVVIPTYNRARYIGSAVRSALQQKYENFEVLVVDDGSHDETEEIISSIQDPRLRYIKKDHAGAPDTRNLGIAEANGEYIFWLDSDDVMMPNVLTEYARMARGWPDADVFYGNIEIFNDAGETKVVTYPDYYQEKNLLTKMIRDSILPNPGSMVRKRLYEQFGGYSRAFRRAHDYEFWTRVAPNARFKHVGIVGCRWRWHEGNMSAGTVQVDTSYEATIVKGLVARHGLKVLFPEAGWENPIKAEARAYLLVAGILEKWRDYKGATECLRKALSCDHEMSEAKAALERLEWLADDYGQIDGRRRVGRLMDVEEPVRALPPLSEQPLVSVIIATKDRRELLPRALESLVNQDYENWEAIIVNDGGEPIEDLIARADDRGRLRHVAHRESLGQAAARNTALRLARGEIICYLDDDDVFVPHHLSTVVSALKEKSGAGVVYTNADVVAEEITERGYTDLERSNPYRHDDYSYNRLLVANYIPINTLAHRWECIAETGGFDEELDCLEDWDLLLRFGAKWEFIHIPRTTVEVRVRKNVVDNVSRRERPQFARTYKKIYARYEAKDAQTHQARQKQLGSLEHGIVREDDPVRRREQDYRMWRENTGLRASDGEIRALRMLTQWAVRPSMHLLTIVQPGQERLLADTLDSLGQQLYKGWGLTVLAHTEAPDALFDQLENLEWVRVEGDFSAAIEQAILETGADWVALIEPGDRFEPHTLLSCGDYINLFRDWRLIYTDEDRIDGRGEYGDPRFKPDFNLDLLRSTPYMGAFCLVRGDALREVGGWRWLAEVGVYDLAFRILEQYGEKAIGHIADVLYHRLEENEARYDKGALEVQARQVLMEHLARSGIAATVKSGLLPMSFLVEYEHADTPLVSIIIPTKDKPEYIKPCLESLLEKTSYPNYEVIVVDNDTTDPEALAFLDKASEDARVRVLRYPHSYNFSTINNMAAREARGDYLVLLNNDTVVVQENWLDRMMAHGQRPEVGIVGARLVYPDGRLQHAGVILGLSGVCDHVNIGLSMKEPGYMARAQQVQNFEAVTAACLLIRKSVYMEVGGLDEERFRVLFNDVDLCLKVREQGYNIVWTPYATLIHHGSVSVKADVSQESRERAYRENIALLDRWLPRLAHDPAYNRNLSLRDRQCAIETEVYAHWDVHFNDRARVLGFPVDQFGCGQHRVIRPLSVLEQHVQIQMGIMPDSKTGRLPEIPELARMEPDILLLQSFVHNDQLQALELFKRYFRARRVFTLDDLMTEIPSKSPVKTYADFGDRLRRALRFCDRLIVTTEPLRQAYGDFIDDIVVLPNYLERAAWEGLQPLRRQGTKPRVGWAGAQQHHGDLELMVEVVKATAKEVDWVFMGMCPDELKPYVAEERPAVPFARYPEALARLNLDLAVAPLEINRFNEAKSNLRILEYGAMGWPVVCTDIEPYKGAPVMRVPNETQAWIEAIRAHVHDLDAAEREGDRLRQWVYRHWMLEDHLDEWMAALTGEVRQRADLSVGEAR